MELSSLLLLFEVSDYLNVLLIIITLVTVRFASKTLLMEYSSQVYISRYRFKSNSKNETIHSWEVDIENKGRGYVVKGFILLSIKDRENKWKKQYHLSKPIVDIDPEEKDTIQLELKDSHFEDFKPLFSKAEIAVYYQDALNNIYVVKPGADKENKHLQKFGKLPKKITFFTPLFFIYKYKFIKSDKQENTYVHRKKKEIEQDKLEAEKHGN